MTTNYVGDVILPSSHLDAYLIYYLAWYTLSLLHPSHPNHHDSRGCVFDWKYSKHDLVDSMRSRPFCDECRNALSSGLLNSELTYARFDALDRILAESRRRSPETSLRELAESKLWPNNRSESPSQIRAEPPPRSHTGRRVRRPLPDSEDTNSSILKAFGLVVLLAILALVYFLITRPAPDDGPPSRTAIEDTSGTGLASGEPPLLQHATGTGNVAKKGLQS